jgi:hypothetical protein
MCLKFVGNRSLSLRSTFIASQSKEDRTDAGAELADVRPVRVEEEGSGALEKLFKII